MSRRANPSTANQDGCESSIWTYPSPGRATVVPIKVQFQVHKCSQFHPVRRLEQRPDSSGLRARRPVRFSFFRTKDSSNLEGWRILARRVRAPGGEVDLVARRGRTVAFVEVKLRGNHEAAAWALDEYRLRRVAVAAERLSPRYVRTADTIRIDAIFIVPGSLPRHLPNIWHG